MPVETRLDGHFFGFASASRGLCSSLFKIRSGKPYRAWNYGNVLKGRNDSLSRVSIKGDYLPVSPVMELLREKSDEADRF